MDADTVDEQAYFCHCCGLVQEDVEVRMWQERKGIYATMPDTGGQAAGTAMVGQQPGKREGEGMVYA